MMSDVLAEALAGATRLLDTSTAQRTWAHAGWVTFAMAAAVAIAIPCAWIASRSPATERGLRRACDGVSSVPALAWLGLCAALLDSGAAIACFLVAATAPALLRGALDGARAIDPDLVDVAVALGLSAGARVRIVTAPMAMPGFFNGLRDASTRASGAAALAAIAGAGGYGEVIVDGIVARDLSRMLSGALAVALFTVMLRMAISLAERALPPRRGARVGRVALSDRSDHDASR